MNNVCVVLQVVHHRRSKPDPGASRWTDSRERKVRLSLQNLSGKCAEMLSGHFYLNLH